MSNNNNFQPLLLVSGILTDSSATSFYFFSLLANIANIALVSTFLQQSDFFSPEIMVGTMLSIFLYSAKILMIYMFLSLSLFLFCSQEILQANSFSSLVKIVLIGDAANLFGDLIHTLIVITNFDDLTKISALYREYPLSLANWFNNDSIILIGILKDINCFQFVGLFLFTYSLKIIAGIDMRLSSKISILTATTTLIITNLMWVLIFITFNNEFSRL